MNKLVIVIAIAFSSLVLNAQNPEFMKTMGETLSQFSTCKSASDFQELGNKFQVIANVENSEWLPLYYHANCYIIMSFQESDAAKRDSYLDVAEKSIDKMVNLAPTEAEVFALQSFYYTARLTVNPQERGQKFSMLSGKAAGKALKMEPSNPRAKLFKIQQEMGSAKFFGQDLKPFCEQATDLMANWDSYVPKSPIHPRWGKDQVARIINGCK